MKSFQSGIGIILALTALASADAESPNHSLEVQANSPNVRVSPRMAARNYLRLPTLDFTFQLFANCSGSFRPGTVTLSIADSRKSLSADQLDKSAAGTEVTVRVPAKQLAPLAIENYCVRPADGESSDDMQQPNHRADVQLAVPAALSVQTSLLCVSEDQEEIVYASNPLDITLICKSVQE